MNHRENNFGRRMIASMIPSRVQEFDELVERYHEAEGVRAAVDAELIQVARQERGWERIKAVELLGVLRVKAAEGLLAEILAELTPPGDEGKEARSQASSSEDLFLIVRLFTALLLINPLRWEAPTRVAAARFGELWVGRALLAVLAMNSSEGAADKSP